MICNLAVEAPVYKGLILLNKQLCRGN